MIILPILILISIGVSSYIYTSYIMDYVSNIVSRETQASFLIFTCILLLLDNWSLLKEIQNFKPIDNQEHIKIIGSQAIELQRDKMIIYELIKIKEHIIEPHQKRKIFKADSIDKMFHFFIPNT